MLLYFLHVDIDDEGIYYLWENKVAQNGKKLNMCLFLFSKNEANFEAFRY